jgi:hypothetical protein
MASETDIENADQLLWNMRAGIGSMNPRRRARQSINQVPPG